MVKAMAARAHPVSAPQRRTGAFSGLRREETIAGYLFLCRTSSAS